MVKIPNTFIKQEDSLDVYLFSKAAPATPGASPLRAPPAESARRALLVIGLGGEATSGSLPFSAKGLGRNWSSLVTWLAGKYMKIQHSDDFPETSIDRFGSHDSRRVNVNGPWKIHHHTDIDR